MIGVLPVIDAADVDLFDDGLILPVPGLAADTVQTEARDGDSILRFLATDVLVEIDHVRVARANDIRIQVMVTDARITLACSKYDKGGGWVGGIGGMIVLNTASKLLASARRRGKMLVGQVRYPWILWVGSTPRRGWGTNEAVAIECRTPEDKPARLTLLLPKDVDASKIAAEICRRAARFRLASEVDLSDDERIAFGELSDAAPMLPGATTEKNEILKHTMPTVWKMGESSARLCPVAEVPEGVTTLPSGDGSGRPTADHSENSGHAEAPATVADGAAESADHQPSEDVPDLAAPATAGIITQGEGMACATCGTLAEPGDAFCTACGSEVSAASQAPLCPTCGAQISETSRFCTQCGVAVVRDRPSRDPVAGDSTGQSSFAP